MLFLLLNASCAYFVIVMLYPSVSSLLSKKTDVIVPKQTPRTTTQSQVSVYPTRTQSAHSDLMRSLNPGPEVINFFSCSTQLSIKF